MSNLTKLADGQKPKPLKQRICKAAGCGIVFTPLSGFQKVCGVRCSIAYVRQLGEAETKKRAGKAKADGRRRLMSKADWTKRAQAAVNAYVRRRDDAKPCVSCGRYHEGQYHAGHYRTTKAAPELRFNPLNIAKQCAPCNNHLSGNIVPFRAELIRRIGIELVEWLEGAHEPKRYRIEDLQAIEAEFKEKLKALNA